MMRTLKFTLRMTLAGLMLTSGVALAAPADFTGDLSVAVAFVPKSATEVDSSTLSYGGTRQVKVTLAVPAGATIATGITLDATSIPTDTNYPAGNTPAAGDPNPADVVVTAVTNCTPTAEAVAADQMFPCTVAELRDGATKDVVVTLSQPRPPTLPTACNHTAVYTAPFTVVATTTSTDLDAGNNTGSVTPTGVALVFADLEVAFTGPESAAEGANVTYTVTVSNLGPCTSSDVWVVSDAYGSSPFVSASWACLNNPPDGDDFETGGCQLGDLTAGSTVTFSKVYYIPEMSSDATSLYHPNGVSLTRRVPDTAAGKPPRATKSAALATTDLDTSNNSDGLSTYVSQAAAGCSTAGAGGPTGLLALGTVLALVFRRRRAG